MQASDGQNLYAGEVMLIMVSRAEVLCPFVMSCASQLNSRTNKEFQYE
jgi:hypothetical protein